MFEEKRKSVQELTLDNKNYNNEAESFESPVVDRFDIQSHQTKIESAEWAMDDHMYKNEFESASPEVMGQNIHVRAREASEVRSINVQMFERQKKSHEGSVEGASYDSRIDSEEGQMKVSLFRRLIHGWTYQAYAIALGTGAIYMLLYNLPYKSSAITSVQIAFFFLSAIFYIFTSVMLILQAILYPKRAAFLLTNPSTTIFVPLLALSSNSLLMGLINYAVPAELISWQVIELFYYLYIVLAVGICIPLLVNWYDKPHDIRTFTPAWAFLVFPMMLAGVLSSRVLSVIPPEAPESVTVFFLGYMFQGLGSCMTFLYLSIYISRIMQTGFMEGHQANGAFVAGGPPGFTAVALIGLGKTARPIFKAHELHELLTEEVGVVFFGLGIFAGIFLLGLCLLFFTLALIPYHKKIHRRLDEVLGLWATTFPNVGMTITLRLLGDFFQSKAIHRAQYVMTTFVFCAYIIALSCTFVALFKGKILRSSHEQVARDSPGHFKVSKEHSQA